MSADTETEGNRRYHLFGGAAMNQIILYGDKKDEQISQTVYRLLESSFHVTHITEAKVRSGGRHTAPINLIETDSLKDIGIKNSILILKNNAKINSLRYVNKTTNVIIHSENTKNMTRLAQYLPNVYTCGFSSKDYVTFSSRGEDKAVVSLQRSVRLINDGSFCEPFEIPCEMEHPLKDYSILAGMMMMILLGTLNETKSKE